MRPKFVQKIIERMEPTVFIGSAILVIGFVVFGSFFTETAARIFGNIQTFIVNTFGWFYVLSASIILIFILYLLFSKYGDIRLGGDSAYISPIWPFLLKCPLIPMVVFFC